MPRKKRRHRRAAPHPRSSSGSKLKTRAACWLCAAGHWSGDGLRRLPRRTGNPACATAMPADASCPRENRRPRPNLSTSNPPARGDFPSHIAGHHIPQNRGGAPAIHGQRDQRQPGVNEASVCGIVDRASAWRQHDAEDRLIFNGKGKNPETSSKCNKELPENLFTILAFFPCKKYTRHQQSERLSEWANRNIRYENGQIRQTSVQGFYPD